MSVEFGELPPSRSNYRRNAWTDEVEALRARPGEWALLARKSSTIQANAFAQKIRSGIMHAFRPAGSFEATQRDCDVWARYIGGGES